MLANTTISRPLTSHPAHRRGHISPLSTGMILLLALWLWAGGAGAAINDLVVAINATTCIPSEDTEASEFRRLSSGEIAFAPGVTGRLTFYCPIPTMQATYNILELVYTDDTGTAWGSWVYAQLRYVADTATGSRFVAYAYSNANPLGTTTPTTTVKWFSHSFNLVTRTYYIRVWLYRNNPDLDPRFRGVRLAYGTE